MRRTCFVMILAFPWYAHSAPGGRNWKNLGVSRNGDQLFYDTSSVMQVSRDSFRVEMKVLHSDGSTTEALDEIDCAHKVVRDLKLTQTKKGQAVRSTNRPSEWRAMELDLTTNELYKTLCRGVPRR